MNESKEVESILDAKRSIINYLGNSILTDFGFEVEGSIGDILIALKKNGKGLTRKEWQAVKNGLRALPRKKELYCVTCIGVVKDVLNEMEGVKVD